MSKGRSSQDGAAEAPVPVARPACQGDEYPTIFEQSRPGRGSARFPHPADAAASRALVPEHLRRSRRPALPEVAEPTVMRHFVRLSQRNHSIDSGFYPLGSCTMKYNPKVNDQIASMPGYARLHPLQSPEDSQGTLELLWRLQKVLGELSGLRGVSLQPAAGAHGEFTGLLIMRAWHERQLHRGRIDSMPTHVIIPDTAHGTNPASVTMAGFTTLSVATDARGGMDVEEVRRLCAEHHVVGLMLTNPNTLGLFDENIAEIAKIVHRAGGLLYYDGANFNAIMGRARPGDMGFDIVHFNVHKSFSTPHGGGGPGAGPVAVRDTLIPFLPVPRVERADDGRFVLDADAPLSIGQIKAFHGNVGVLVRAYAYLRLHGRDGLRRASELAVLNANYLMELLRDVLPPAYDRHCTHEFVSSAAALKATTGVRALDVAKRLMDYGFHPPTIYFPLLVEEALMIEPTETETPETLERFADAVHDIVAEARTDPGVVFTAPHTAPVRRLDEAVAVRQPKLRARIDVPLTRGADEHGELKVDSARIDHAGDAAVDAASPALATAP